MSCTLGRKNMSLYNESNALMLTSEVPDGSERPQAPGTIERGELSGRRILALATGAAAAVGISSRAEASVPPFRSYHDVNSYWHGMYQRDLMQAGYRPISVSIYGTSGSPVFAAVWVQKSGPPWRMCSQV